MKLIFVLDCSERCRRDQEAFGDREGRLGEAAGRRREHDEEPLKTQNFTQHSGTSHRSTDIVKKRVHNWTVCLFIQLSNIRLYSLPHPWVYVTDTRARGGYKATILVLVLIFKLKHTHNTKAVSRSRSILNKKIALLQTQLDFSALV